MKEIFSNVKVFFSIAVIATLVLTIVLVFAPTASAADEYHFCPYCGVEFQNEYSYCPSCGRSLASLGSTSTDPSQSTGKMTPANDSPYCSQCGNNNVEDTCKCGHLVEYQSNYCPCCGQKIERCERCGAPISSRDQAHHEKGYIAIAVVAWTVAAGLGIAAVYWLYEQEGDVAIMCFLGCVIISVLGFLAMFVF